MASLMDPFPDGHVGEMAMMVMMMVIVMICDDDEGSMDQHKKTSGLEASRLNLASTLWLSTFLTDRVFCDSHQTRHVYAKLITAKKAHHCNKVHCFDGTGYHVFSQPPKVGCSSRWPTCRARG